MIIGSFAQSLLNFRGALLKTLITKGHQVISCAPDATDGIRGDLAHMGVRYFQIPLVRAGLSPMEDLKTFMALRKMIRHEKPDRILAYTAKPVIYAHLAAIMSGRAPVVYGMITGLGYGFGNRSIKQKLVGFVMRILYRVALKRSAGIFFQNPDDLSIFSTLNLLPKKVPATIINGSGVDLTWYSPQPLPAEMIFLFVARLLEEKGIREYYQAARMLKKKYPHARFQIAGDYDVNPTSIHPEEIKKWQSDGIIEYLGKFDDIRPCYKNAKVFVLPSYREGTPRTVLEAMSMGRPVITTDTPGCRETVVDGENGFLVPVKDPEMLANAMERFIFDPRLAIEMGEKSLRYAVEKYDVHKVNAVILNAMGL
jgi:glycosyltransferase involved in cell wall biosynthesis